MNFFMLSAIFFFFLIRKWQKKIFRFRLHLLNEIKLTVLKNAKLTLEIQMKILPVLSDLVFQLSENQFIANA